MTFFEKELHRIFDDSECISADAVFAGKTMIAPIGEDLRAKVQFVYTNTHAKYDACGDSALDKRRYQPCRHADSAGYVISRI